MNDEELQAIKARAEKATPGPWKNDIFVWGHVVNDDAILPNNYVKAVYEQPKGTCGRSCIEKLPLLRTTTDERGQHFHHHAEPRARTDDYYRDIYAWTGVKIVGNYDYEEGGVSSTKEDSDFIAHAREDVPRLVAEVERLNGLQFSGPLCASCQHPVHDVGKCAIKVAPGDPIAEICLCVSSGRDWETLERALIERVEEVERLRISRDGWERDAHTYAESRDCQEQMKDRNASEIVELQRNLTASEERVARLKERLVEERAMNISLQRAVCDGNTHRLEKQDADTARTELTKEMPEWFQ